MTEKRTYTNCQFYWIVPVTGDRSHYVQWHKISVVAVLWSYCLSVSLMMTLQFIFHHRPLDFTKFGTELFKARRLGIAPITADHIVCCCYKLDKAQRPLGIYSKNWMETLFLLADQGFVFFFFLFFPHPAEGNARSACAAVIRKDGTKREVRLWVRGLSWSSVRRLRHEVWSRRISAFSQGIRQASLGRLSPRRRRPNRF